jgi:predicted MFS family arabinose efflux permease
MTERISPLAPFRARSFRFQWAGDLVTSWAFEMETLILGWYVLTATGSVQQLVLFGALIWIGSLFSPFFGLAADRFGVRAVLCVMRGAYLVLALVLTALVLGGALQPWHVFVLTALAGLARPSDQAMRIVLIGQTIEPRMIMSALAISRSTFDSSKVAGALAGAGGVALVGMGPAYAVVTVLYVVAFVLTLFVARSPPRSDASASGGSVAEVLAGLAEGVRYLRSKPDVFGAFLIVFLVNLLAYPFVLGLLPYVARDVFGTDQYGLGHLAASFALGALIGTLLLLARRVHFAAARLMLIGAGSWFAFTTLLAFVSSLPVAIGLVFLAGVAQSFCMTPIAAVMLRSTSEGMRGRVMGMRMLAVWGLPLGLLAAGPIIEYLGFTACVLLYGGAGLAATVGIGYRWRGALWERSAEANTAGSG